MKKERKWQLCAFVMASTYRRRLTATMYNTPFPLNPTILSERTGIKVSHVSRSLKELKNKGIVFCVNPKDRKFRGYGLTVLGDKIYEMIKKMK